jgi:hypothetical protein
MEFYDSSQITEDLAKRNFATGLLRIEPNGTAPIFAMSGLAKRKKTGGITHGYWTKSAEFTTIALTADVTADDQTTMSVSSGDAAKLISGMIFRYQDPTDPSGVLEHIRIQSVSGTTVTILRGFGGTTAESTIADTTVLTHVGNAHEQGSAPPNPRSIGMALHTNNTQIFRNAWGLSRTLSAIEVEVGDGNKAENRRDAMFFHAQDMETATLFSTRSPDPGSAAPVLNNRPVTTMDGVESTIRRFAPQNIAAAGSTTSFDQLETILDPLLDNRTNMSSSNARTIYCGKTALKVFNDIGKSYGTLQLERSETVYGQRFRMFHTNRGDFRLVEHPILNTNPVWAKMAFVLDFSSFDYRWLRPTFEEMIKGSGKDEDAGVMTSEFTFEMNNPFANGVIHNMTAAA